MPTSVPVWPVVAPAVDSGGRDFSVLTIGETALAVGDSWRRQVVDLGRPLRTFAAQEGDGEAARWADRQAGAARVGWRFMVAGPEDDVLGCLAAVRGRGGLDAELRAHVTCATRRRVTCAHCRTITVTSAPVAATCACEGCSRELLIYHHVSPRQGSYLGFMVDAEEAP